jgi:predicted PurR-regulated permease PerM
MTKENDPIELDPAPQNLQELGGNWLDARQIRLLVTLVVAGIGLYLCYLLTVPFLSSLTWSLVLSVVFMPMHRRVESIIVNRSAAALITAVSVAILVVVPVFFVAQQLLREIANGAVYLESELRNGSWRETVGDYPAISRAATWIEEQLDLAGAAGGIATWLTGLSTTLLRSSANQLLNVVLTFYLFFYFLRDREKALASLEAFSFLSAAETNEVCIRFVEAIHATVFGTLIVAIVQGTLGGLMFWWLGLPLPLLWGTVMGMLAIVPVLGAFVIWIPAAIYLMLEGHWSKALILAGWGGIVVASIDNFIYPILIGNRLKLHTTIVLVGTLGGIVVFGAPGLIIGPAITSTTLCLLQILKKRFNRMNGFE